MDLNPEALHPIREFAQDGATVKELRPQWWNSYESQIQQIQVTDTIVNFNADSTTAVGSLILAYARRNFGVPISEESLVIASQAVRDTMYATLINTFMLRPAKTSPVQAKLTTTTTNRLFVIDAIAGIILGFLVLVAALLVLVLFYSKDHTSVLFEELVGILGYAGLLVDSDVDKLALDARKAKDFRGRTRSDVERSLSHAGHTMRVFRMADFRKPRMAHIVQDRTDGGDDELSSLPSDANGRQARVFHSVQTKLLCDISSARGLRNPPRLYFPADV